jgi:hypothetical protein
MSALVTQEQLLQVTGYKVAGEVLERKLSDQGIRFFYGRNGCIWTTMDLINAAGGLSKLESRELTADDIV